MAGPVAVHLGIIERVAAREDQVAEALAVGARQPAVGLEQSRTRPGRACESTHRRNSWPNSRCSRCAGNSSSDSAAARPQRRTRPCQRLGLELVDVLTRRRRGQRMPVEVEPCRLERFADLIALVERPRGQDLLRPTPAVSSARSDNAPHSGAGSWDRAPNSR